MNGSSKSAGDFLLAVVSLLMFFINNGIEIALRQRARELLHGLLLSSPAELRIPGCTRRR